METPDEKHLSKARAEAVTIEELWQLFPYLAGVLNRRGLSTEEAEDIAQETLYAAWQNRDGFRQDAGLSSWVFGIAKKKWLQWHRDRRRLKRDGIEVEVSEYASEGAMGAVLVSADAGPEERLMAKERYLAVRRTLPTLPKDMSTALVLHVHQGRSYKEIATLFRSDVNHVSSLIYQARQKLRRAVPQPSITQGVKHG